jgi:hypothetical protein
MRRGNCDSSCLLRTSLGMSTYPSIYCQQLPCEDTFPIDAKNLTVGCKCDTTSATFISFFLRKLGRYECSRHLSRPRAKPTEADEQFVVPLLRGSTHLHHLGLIHSIGLPDHSRPTSLECSINYSTRHQSHFVLAVNASPIPHLLTYIRRTLSLHWHHVPWSALSACAVCMW